MLVTTNTAGFKFVWNDGSDIIEVYRPGDPEGVPFEAIYVETGHSKELLNRIANEDPSYSQKT